MRSIRLVLLLAVAVPLGAKELGRWSLHSELDLYLALKAGTGYQVSDRLGVRGSIGLCAISPTQLSYTLIGVAHFLRPTGFQVDLHFGLVQATLDLLGTTVSQPFTYWVPGLCLAVGYRWPSGHGIAVRGGAGLMFGYDLGAWQGPDIVPNAALEYSWRGAARPL